MSGPKISVYSLTGRAREIVLGQMRCEQKAVACAAEIKRLIACMRADAGGLATRLANLRLLAKRRSEGEEALRELTAFQTKLQTQTLEMEGELRAHKPRMSRKYRISEEDLAEKQAELKRLQAMKKRAEALYAELSAAADSPFRETAGKKASVSLQTGREETLQKLQDSIAADVSGVYSFEPDTETADTEFEDRKRELLAELTGIAEDASLPAALREESRSAIRSLRRISAMPYLTTFDSVTAAALRKKTETVRREHEQRERVRRELLARYEALCGMADEPLKQPPDSGAAAKFYAAEIERLELLLVREQEQAYIRTTVDEVMEEMGYDLIGSRQVRKKNGRQFRNELFTFREGTAVNVTYSSDGQISMELGGLARADRIPTAEETETLTEDMEHFCSEFAEFEQRLLARGIVLGKRIAMAPPTAEYAAIINLDDYRIETGKQVFEMASVETKTKKAAKKNVRRKE